MVIQRDISLKNYSTFSVSSKARIMAVIEEIEDVHQLPELLSQYPDHLVLGEGSNTLFASDHINHLLIKNNINGIQISKETDDEIEITVGGGENWHQLVKWTVEKSFYGLENLALIPGTTGAAPVQNIGAYGVEQEDYFSSLQAYDLKKHAVVQFDKKMCRFSYRDSFFKQNKGRFLITSVTYRLNKGVFKPNISYKAVSDYFKINPGKDVNKQKTLFEAIIKIRSSKLPDPEQLGNAGSFFKNPIISKNKFDKLISTYPEMPSYSVNSSSVKIPAAWLIDQCGWKGYRKNDAGVYPKQALVLVNYGEASGAEICALADEIKQSVKEKFSIEIIPEVNIIQ